MSSNAPTIIKKVKKGGHAHPHSSAWKVAYADFVTAMMAFFLLLWLLNVTTDEQKQGIADYFMPTLAVDGVQGNVGFTGGSVTDLDGPLETPAMGAPSVVVGLPPRTEGVQRERAGPSDEEGGGQASPAESVDPAAARLEEERRFDDLERRLREAIANDPELQGLEANLVIDRSEEGLRIQIVDQDERSMFPRGSAEMYPFMTQLLAQVAKVMGETTNKVSISGHTDATAFLAGSTNDNWALSALRANAARRALVEAGLDGSRLARVMGKAETEPFDPVDPTAAVNRRIAVVLLYAQGPRPELAGGSVGTALGGWRP